MDANPRSLRLAAASDIDSLAEELGRLLRCYRIAVTQGATPALLAEVERIRADFDRHLSELLGYASYITEHVVLKTEAFLGVDDLPFDSKETAPTVVGEVEGDPPELT